jgi:hypothetical protein
MGSFRLETGWSQIPGNETESNEQPPKSTEKIFVLIMKIMKLEWEKPPNFIQFSRNEIKN